jgi:hypothetical protein
LYYNEKEETKVASRCSSRRDGQSSIERDEIAQYRLVEAKSQQNFAQ